jgi:predicted NBD/HSP70 family sugar kinase
MAATQSGCFGIDLGGTKLAAASADTDGSLLHELVEPTDPRGGVHVAEQLVSAVRRLAGMDGSPPVPVRAVVIGVPGVVDPGSQRISQIPHIRGFDGMDVAGFISERLGTRVELHNDVNLAMLGEHALGGAAGLQHAAFLSLGTGAGLGLLLNGRLYTGATGAAGEIADLPQEGLRDGSPVTFETEVRSQAIMDRYRLAGGTGAATVRELFARANDGDRIASEVLDETARRIAQAIVTLQAVLDLQRVVLGGSIGVRPELVSRVERAIPELTTRPIPVVPSELGDRAGLRGALWAASLARTSVS